MGLLPRMLRLHTHLSSRILEREARRSIPPILAGSLGLGLWSHPLPVLYCGGRILAGRRAGSRCAANHSLPDGDAPQFAVCPRTHPLGGSSLGPLLSAHLPPQSHPDTPPPPAAVLVALYWSFMARLSGVRSGDVYSPATSQSAQTTAHLVSHCPGLRDWPPSYGDTDILNIVDFNIVDFNILLRPSFCDHHFWASSLTGSDFVGNWT